MATRTNLERGRDARDRLLAAARELIPELGWNAVSTRVLAERAGVRPGLVHYHFASVQDLLRRAVLDEMRRMTGEAAALVDGTGSGSADGTADGSADSTDRIGSLFGHLDQYTGSDRESLLFVEGFLAATRDPVLQDGIATILAGLRSTVAQSLARAGHPDPEETAVVVLAAIDGLLLHKGIDPTLTMARAAPLMRTLIDVEPNGGSE